MTAGSLSAAADRALVSRIISRKSLPVLPVNPLESLLHALFDLLSFLVEMFGLSQMFHPRLFLGRGPQFLLDSFGDQLAQRDSAFGRHRLSSAEQKIGDLEGCLHTPILPYLWDLPSG